MLHFRIHFVGCLVLRLSVALPVAVALAIEHNCAKALIVLLETGRIECNWRRSLSQLSFWFIFPLTRRTRWLAGSLEPPILIAFIINNFTIKYYRRGNPRRTHTTRGRVDGWKYRQLVVQAALGSSATGQLNKIYRLASLIRCDVLLLLGFCLALAVVVVSLAVFFLCFAFFS